MRLSLKNIIVFSAALALWFGAAAEDYTVNIDGRLFIIHSVEQGETLYSLARNNSTTVDAIVEANPALKEGLKAGQTIKIPTKAEAEPQVKRNKRHFLVHTVLRGETLYSVSRLFSVSVDALLDDNPMIDPTRLSVGTKIYVRKDEIGRTTKSQTLDQIKKTGETLSSVADEEIEYHVVESGETFRSIAEKSEISEKALLDMNSLSTSANISEGSIIKIPKKIQEQATAEEEVKKERAQVKLSRLDFYQTADIALMLPFTQKGAVSDSYVDFYKGFLLGLGHCRENGRKVKLKVFDTMRDSVRVAKMVEDGLLDGTDLIVGPVYEQCTAQVIEFAEKRSIPVLSPLATVKNISSPSLFQMAPSAETRYEKLRPLFAPERRVVFLHTAYNDAEFVECMKEIAGNRKIEYREYAFENPNAIEKRERARAAGAHVAESKGDLIPLLHHEGEMTIVVTAATETDVDRILAAISSAATSLRDRSMTVADFQVIGNGKWMHYTNIDHAMFFRNNVRFCTSYMANATTEPEVQFNRRYASEFGTLPSLYSCRGYDAAVIFVEALFGDIEHGLEGNRYIPIEVPYSFLRTEDDPTIRNREWVKVSYNDDFTVSVE